MAYTKGDRADSPMKRTRRTQKERKSACSVEIKTA